jgi:hypothetical protein
MTSHTDVNNRTMQQRRASLDARRWLTWPKITNRKLIVVERVGCVCMKKGERVQTNARFGNYTAHYTAGRIWHETSSSGSKLVWDCKDVNHVTTRWRLPISWWCHKDSVESHIWVVFWSYNQWNMNLKTSFYNQYTTWPWFNIHKRCRNYH